VAFYREEFGRELRELLQRRGLSYRDVQTRTDIAFSQVGDLCKGLIRTRAQIGKLIAGLDLDPVEWMVKAGFVPEGIVGDTLVQALGALGDVAVVQTRELDSPSYESVSAGPGTLPPEASSGPTHEALSAYDYTVRVRGDSMSGVLEDGDIAFVKAQEHALSGDIVVAWVRGEAVVKRLRKTNGMVTLISANDRYEEIPATEVRILGIVTGFYRRQ
jgi:repressor LexA